MSEETDDGRVPRFAYDDQVRRANAYQKKTSELQAKLDRQTADNSVRDVLAKTDPAKTDTANLESFLRGSNLRVVDDKAIVDIDGLTMTLAEAYEYMQGKPEKFGNLTNIEKPREPTAQEKHLAWLRTLTPDQYNAYRRKHGRAYLDPPTE